MSDEPTSDVKTSNDEKSSGLGKLESMSKDELIKIVKNQIINKKKLELKITELTNANTNLTQIENDLRNEMDQSKLNQSKLEDELNTTRTSFESLRSENETLETSSKNLQNEILNLQNELSIVRSSLNDESQKSLSHSDLLSKLISITINLFQLSISSPDSIDNEFLKIYKNELEQKQDFYKQTFDNLEQEKQELQQRIEDLEFFNEELKLEMDDLRSKSKNFQHEKQLMEKEIDNYRRQVEDFEEQFLELQRETNQNSSNTHEKSSQQSSEELNQISSQCMNTILKNIDNNNDNHQYPHISKSSSTSSLLLSSDIPTLLHSVGITNCTDEEFSVPLNFESVLRLCTLLIERCRVLQYILLKNNDNSINNINENHYDNECVLFTRNEHWEQCKIFIHKQDHIGLDTLFERIYNGMNEKINSDDWTILIEKAVDQNTSPSIRLEFDNFKFVPEEINQNLIELRSQYDQLLKENQTQRIEISKLEKQLQSTNSYEQLKQHQTYLEEQLAQQCQKTIQLENTLKQANIDKTQFEQLKQIEYSYNELLEKYHIAEQLEKQIKDLKENLNEKNVELKQQNDLFEKIKIDYERQHFHLLERDENLRLLKLESDEQKQNYENMIDKYEKQIKTIENHIEQQKNLILNTTQNNDERYSVLIKEKNQFNDLIQIKINENQILLEKNVELEKNFNENKKMISEKEQLINQLQEKFDLLNIEYEELNINFNQIKDEKYKLTNEINLLMDKTDILDKDKPQAISEDSLQLENLRKENEKLQQTIKELNEKIEKQNPESGENIQELKEKYQKMKILLTRLKKELQDKTHQPKQSLIDLELADYEKTIKNVKDELINKDKDLQELRDELSNSTEKYTYLKIEIKNLEQQKLQAEERANKFKSLLDIAKKELQNAKDVEIKRYQNDDDLTKLNENLQHQFDTNKTLINQLLNEKQQLTEKLNNQNETYQKTIQMLEQNLRIAKHELSIAKQDYDTLQDDFNSYKVRAQSVLKQHQSNQRERTPSLAEKQAELEQTIEKLKTTLQEANNKIESLISENEALHKENDRLIESQTKLINESKKREQDLRKQHQLDIDKIQNDYLQRINESHDLLKNMSLQNETLSIAFKEQIATMESEYSNKISLLQNQLENSRQEIEQLKIRIESLLEQINLTNEKLTANTEGSQIGIMNDSSRDNTLAWSDYERQQRENLESVNLNHQSTEISIKTSENIQFNDSSTIANNTTINHNSIPSTPNEKTTSISFENNDNERQRIEDELNKTKIRLLDTIELLNESESNNKRLNEQVALLKDEIRRIERNMDRAESISNLEYLKNIILKFFILKSSPERLQLIPVLVTMLKLSPDEQAQLVRVANMPMTTDENFRNDESSSPPSQPNTNGATSPSWGSYLNIW